MSFIDELAEWAVDGYEHCLHDTFRINWFLSPLFTLVPYFYKEFFIYDCFLEIFTFLQLFPTISQKLHINLENKLLPFMCWSFL